MKSIPMIRDKIKIKILNNTNILLFLPVSIYVFSKEQKSLNRVNLTKKGKSIIKIAARIVATKKS